MSHDTQTPMVFSINRNVHPSKSVSPDRNPQSLKDHKLRSGSQEPRRPRFSFFHSSRCQRADPKSPQGQKTSMLPLYTKDNKTAKSNRTSGINSALFRSRRRTKPKRQTRSVSAGGLYERENTLSTPYFKVTETKNFVNTFNQLASRLETVSGPVR